MLLIPSNAARAKGLRFLPWALIALVCALWLSPSSALAADPEEAPEAVPTALCDTVTEIPLSECQALVAFYNSTNGGLWDSQETSPNKWLQSTTPCSWFGVTCNATTPKRVTAISLQANNVTGGLTDTLTSLTMLQTLNLSSNLLGSSMPDIVGDLPTSIRVLDLSNNQVFGGIPSTISSLSQLREVDLSANPLGGTLPFQLGNLSQLRKLIITDAQITGTVTSALGNLALIQVIELSNNNLRGSIPTSLGSITSLQELYLDNNQLSGTIPVGFGTLPNLRVLRLGRNQLTGTIPTTFGTAASQLRELSLFENSITGTIPSSLGNLTTLQELSLTYNRLSGTIPTTLGNLSNLTGLYLYSNLLTGTLPPELGNLTALQSLSVENNALSGEIPATITNLTGLTLLELGYNKFVSTNPTVRAYLDIRDFDWEDTQTVPPQNISALQVTTNTLQLFWNPVRYTFDTGYYEVGISSTPGGPYTVRPEHTNDKTQTNIIISGLAPGTHYLSVRTFTAKHDFQQNDLYSTWGNEVEFEAGGVACRQVDVDCNGVVNIHDINRVAQRWETPFTQTDRENVNGDSKINIVDLMLVTAAWGT